jgi:hypothetical protein
MTQLPSINERRPPLHAFQSAHRKATWWLAAIVGAAALLLATPAPGHAESNPNNYICHGHTAAGELEEGSTETPVKYTIACNGPITGYQLLLNIPEVGVASPPIVTNAVGKILSDTFSCSGEIPGYAANCVGSTKLAYATITGQFSIGTKLCAEPRVDPLLTVTYAYLEKGVVTQAISGPFDLGRPYGCPPSKFGGEKRFSPKFVEPLKDHKKHSKKKATSKKK